MQDRMPLQSRLWQIDREVRPDVEAETLPRDLSKIHLGHISSWIVKVEVTRSSELEGLRVILQFC